MLDGLTVEQIDPVLRALTTAREKLDEKEWIQGHLAVDEKGDEVPIPCGVGLCAVGFVRLAFCEHRIMQGHIPSLTYTVLLCSARDLGYNYQTVTAWNDAHDRTKEQVIEVFEHAIARVKKLLEGKTPNAHNVDEGSADQGA